jgi:hypothetical protein
MPFKPVDFRFLLDQHGQDVTLRYVTKGTYSPSTGGLTGGSTTDKTVKAYFYNYMLEEINGQSVQMGDRRVVLHTLDTSGDPISEPSVDDLILGQGDTVSIVSVQKIFSDVLVCYILQVRE